MKHLSPSTFMTFRKCAYKVKLLKIDKVLGEDHGDQQSLAMATGNAFDILVKCALNRRYDKAALLLTKIPDSTLRKSALLVADELFEIYSDGPLNSLRAEGVGYVGVDQEVELSFTNISGKSFKSILYGMPDVVLTDGTVVDWKVNGAYGKGTEPTNGYCRCWIKQGNRWIEDGPSGKSDQSLEHINEDWAIQTYLYARLLGKKPGDAIRAGIEQIAIKGNEVKCASFRNPISKEFQLQIEGEFHQAWTTLTNSSETVSAHPGRRTCYSYGKLCVVADHCGPYKRLKELDPDAV